jgi:sporulation protein YlmC with PRC-barrel domain
MFFIRKPFNTFIMLFLLAAHLPSTQADEQPAKQSVSEQDVSTSKKDPVAKEELAKEAIDGQIAHDSYRNDWQHAGGVVVQIATSEDVYQPVSVESLKGRRVVNLNAKSVGKVHDVVLTDGKETTALIIESGGFFGIGAAESLVPLEDFYFVGEQLVWETKLSKGELKKTDQFGYDDNRVSSLLEE